MKGVIHMADNGCITYHLPDGDRTVVSWEYVMTQLTELITPINTALIAENNALDRIITKVDSWLEENTES
jgi:hypothetical protein